MAIDEDTLVVSTQNTHYFDLAVFCPGMEGFERYPQYDDGCDWVYVFERGADGRWSQTAKLVPIDTRTLDTFGAAVDVDHRAGVIVVGNPGDKVKSNIIHIFERQTNGTWLETATIHKEYPHLPADTAANFGISVAVSGGTVAAADGLGPNATTYLYEKNETGWQEVGSVAGGGGPKGVAMAGDTLVTVKWWREPYDCGGDNGMLRLGLQLYERVDGKWLPHTLLDPQKDHGPRQQTAPTRLTLDPTGTRLLVGAAVDLRVYGLHTEYCLSGDLPRVGAFQVSTDSKRAFGSAWIYERLGDEWRLRADLPNPMPQLDPAFFGAAVGIDGSTAVISARQDSHTNGSRSGAAYVYGLVDGSWELSARIENHDNSRGDRFGYGVAVSGEDVLVGAPGNEKVGSVHVFRPATGSVWPLGP